MVKYFADTYAIIEILRGNEKYKPYIPLSLATTDFNLLELSYALVRDYGKEKALKILSDVRDSFEVVGAEMRISSMLQSSGSDQRRKRKICP